MKLYLVELKGFGCHTSGTNYKSSYVVAENADKAYQQVKKFLDEADLGFTHEREMNTITLLAETGAYPNCETMLFNSEAK